MKSRRKRNGCSVEEHSGHLRLRFRWRGKRFARSSALIDTPENRGQLERLARLIGAAIAAGQDPRPILQGATEPAQELKKSPTVAGYFELWIVDKVPPMVRRAQARDYRRHISGYVLPRLGAVELSALTSRDVLGMRTELLQLGLSLKYVKNIVSGSFKAMIRDAREIDGLMQHDPFVGVRWGRIPVAGPEPFAAEEAQRIIRWFANKRFGFHAGRSRSGFRLRPHAPYHALVHTLFWTGLRPSEAAGLQWGDLDLGRRILRVVRSRHLGEDSAPKTGQAARTVELLTDTVELLRLIQPLRTTPSARVFTNVDGGPLEPKTFSAHWYRCLRALGLRVRGLYATKDTYISLALSAGVKIPWLEAQTGVRYETLRRHYGMWLRAEGGDQLERLARLAPMLAPSETTDPQLVDDTDLLECEEGDLNQVLHASTQGILRP